MSIWDEKPITKQNSEWVCLRTLLLWIPTQIKGGQGEVFPMMENYKLLCLEKTVSNVCPVIIPVEASCFEGRKQGVAERRGFMPPSPFDLSDKWRDPASVLLIVRSWLEPERNVWSDSLAYTWSGLAEWTADRKGIKVVQRIPFTV